MIFYSKKLLLKVCSPLLLAIIFLSCKSDDPAESNLRYFRFISCSMDSYGRWQDTSFVAATSTQTVIEQCRAQLALPYASRNLFPFGDISSGSKGYNRNGSHFFSWHYVEDSWELVEMGIEIYDGCAYSDAELADYVTVHGRYGGWGNRVVEELSN